jgi:hypothetical protein
LCGVQFGFNERSHGAKSVKALGTRELDIRLLEIAGSDVVDDGITENGGSGFFPGFELGSPTSHNNPEFSFVIDALGLQGIDDIVLMTYQSARGLQKNKRLFRNFVAELSGVVLIIAPDGDYLRGEARGKKLGALQVEVKLGPLPFSKDIAINNGQLVTL